MTTLFEDRMTGGVAPDVPVNEVLATILGHRSCRAFRDEAVAPEVLQALVLAGQSAPSSCNLQCWSVVAVDDRALKSALNAISGQQRQVEEAPVFLCFLADLARIGEIAAAGGFGTDSLEYLEMFLMGAIDASLAAQNLATAAESMGLGTCYIGGLRNDISEAARLLGLPDRVVPVFGMALGHPDPARPASVKPRLPAETVLHFNGYSAEGLAGQVAAYEDRLAGFNAGQGRQVDSWARKSAERVATVARMDGREALSPKLSQMGLAQK